MKAARLLPLAFACLSLLPSGGCLLAPIIPERFFTIESPLGVRHDAKTNVVERLVEKNWFVVHASIIAEPSYSRCYRTRVFLERTNQASLRYKSLEELCRDDRFGEKWLTKGWHFRPMPATNLWIGVYGAAQLYRQFWITEAGGKGIDFVVCVFGPQTTLSEKHLRTFAADGRLGFPELMFDPQSQRLTYSTRQGYETYSLVDGTVLPASEPPNAPTLLPRDFGFKDMTEVSEGVGTDYQYYVKVQGPVDQYSRATNAFLIGFYNCHQYSRTTNGVLVGLYNAPPDNLVHQQVVATKGFADIHQINIQRGTGVVTYKSGDDDFAYDAVENSFKRASEPQ